jgi:hypothetical protein
MPTKTVETFTRREQLEALKSELAVQIPMTVKVGFKAVRGAVMGIITASGLLRRRSRTTTAGTGFSNASPVGQVTDASVFAVGDVLKKTDGTVIGTVQGIDVTTNPDTVTLQANAAVNVAAATDIVASDGSEKAAVIADEATDGAEDTVISPYISGLLKENLLSGLDASAKTELGGRSLPGNIFKF